jgi:anti-sigma-K factor RskA
MDNTNAQDDTWESKLIDYTLGLMDPGEAADFASGLAECRQHVQLANHYEQTMAWMGASAQAAEPPQGHKDRLMSKLKTTPQAEVALPALPALTEPTPTEGTSTISTALPESVISDATTFEAKTEANAAEPLVVDLAKYRERRRNTFIGALGAIAAALILVIGLSALLGPGSKLVIPSGYRAIQLAPQAGFDSASAVVLYDPTRNDATLLATGFPQVPAGKVYELWMVPPSGTGAPVQAGTFVPDSVGSSQHDASVPQNVGTYAGIAVTLEDAPGGDTPKGAFVVVGPLPSNE